MAPAEDDNITPRDRNDKGIPPEELIPKDEIESTSAAISDRLFFEISSTGKKVVIHEGTDKEEKVNWYHAEAAKYARRASAGNFGKSKPIFDLDPKDFSPELRADLVKLLKTSKESLHRVVEDAVFMIFRARHPMIFYQHIEAEGLRWRFV